MFDPADNPTKVATITLLQKADTVTLRTFGIGASAPGRWRKNHCRVNHRRVDEAVMRSRRLAAPVTTIQRPGLPGRLRFIISIPSRIVSGRNKTFEGSRRR